MNSTTIELLKSVTLETLILSFIIFSLTMILKLPIKNLTSKFNEEKRKSINSLIILLPIILCILITTIYCKLFNINLHNNFITISFNSLILTYSLYTIYERSKYILKSLFSSNLTKKEIILVNKEIKKCKDDISLIIAKIKKNENIKNQLNDLSKIYDQNITLKNLFEEKENIENYIKEKERELKILKERNRKE